MPTLIDRPPNRITLAAAATLATSMTSPQPSRLTLTSSDKRVIAASGVIDSHTADGLLVELHTLGTSADATLDLAAVDFIDSSGLRAIVGTHQKFEASSHKLILSNPSESVTRLLEITGLLGIVHVTP